MNCVSPEQTSCAATSTQADKITLREPKHKLCGSHTAPHDQLPEPTSVGPAATLAETLDPGKQTPPTSFASEEREHGARVESLRHRCC